MRRGIAIFEGVDRRFLPILAMPLQAGGLAVLSPFIRPFKWSRLALTYVVPLVPLIVVFNGTVSMLRVYAPSELRELVASVPGHASFDWDIGTMRTPASPFALTHLVGTPRAR